jgi:hypothetical protein
MFTHGILVPSFGAYTNLSQLGCAALHPRGMSRKNRGASGLEMHAAARDGRIPEVKRYGGESA